jgi:hypothetical protein
MPKACLFQARDAIPASSRSSSAYEAGKGGATSSRSGDVIDRILTRSPKVRLQRIDTYFSVRLASGRPLADSIIVWSQKPLFWDITGPLRCRHAPMCAPNLNFFAFSFLQRI